MGRTSLGAGIGAALLALAASGLGCTAAFMESVSESVSSPFTLISESSSKATGLSYAYLRDVELLSELYAQAGPDRDGFLRELGRTALAHGISDWEAHPESFEAIGRGWRRAGIETQAARRLADMLFGAGSPATGDLLRAYAG